MTNLTDFKVFSGLGKKEIHHVQQISTQVQVPAGREIIVEGSRGRECFVVLTGSVGIDRHGERVAEVGPGEVVGEIALLDSDRRTRTATAVALTDADVLVFTSREFASLLDEHPSVAARIERTAVKRLVEDLDADES